MNIYTRLLLAIASMISVSLSAQDLPNRPVHVVIPQTPGGANDALGRLVAQKLSEKWSQPMVVENRGGAGGNIGTEHVVLAPIES